MKKLQQYMNITQAITQLSKDPTTKVAALAIDQEHGVLSTGYNGFPRRIHDHPQLLNDRVEKHKRTVHAEANLVAQAARSGVSLKGCTVLVCGLFPCSQCAGLLIQAGVVRVVVRGGDSVDWDTGVARELFGEAGVEVVEL